MEFHHIILALNLSNSCLFIVLLSALFTGNEDFGGTYEVPGQNPVAEGTVYYIRPKLHVFLFLVAAPNSKWEMCFFLSLNKLLLLQIFSPNAQLTQDY